MYAPTQPIYGLWIGRVVDAFRSIVLVVAVGRRRGLDVEDVAAGAAELLVLAVAVGLRQGDGQLAGGCAALGDVGDLVLVVLALAPDERVQA